MKRRPRTILWCEVLGLVTLVLRVATAFWGDAATRIAQADAVTAPGTGMMLVGLGIVAPTVLAWWATRGRSRAAAWFLAAWIALLTVVAGAQFARGSIRPNLFGLMTLFAVLLYIVMAALLFGRTARRWLRHEKDAAEIGDLFA